MKKIIFTLLVFAGFLSMDAQIIITELADPNDNASCRYIELYNFGTSSVDLSAGDYKLGRYTNGNTTFTTLGLTGTIPANGFYIVGKSAHSGCYGSTPDQTSSSSVVDSNGDDQIVLLQGGGNTLIDIFGVVGEDGTGTCHEFEDGRAERVATVTGPNTTWDDTEWNVWADNERTDGNGAVCVINDPQNVTDMDPGAWIGAVPTTSTVGFTTVTSNLPEGDAGLSMIAITIEMNIAPNSDVILDVISVENTATEGVDYVAVSETLTFTPAGALSQTIMISANGDTDIEPDEMFDLLLDFAPSNTGTATLGTIQNTVTIPNDDVGAAPAIIVNEVDSDTPGSDTADEFIEIKGDPNTALDNATVVLFNGNGDNAYEVYDLDGFTTDANGFFIIGNIAGADIVESAGFLQNGADAVAIYGGDFTNGDPATSTNLIDALVYDTNDSDDTVLMTTLGVTEQINEDENGSKDTHSIQRGSWFVAPPTPRATNVPLPVDLIAFNARLDNTATQLTWQTALEVNNDYFQVEYSTNGTDFKAIGQERGQGESYDLQNYTFTHEAPVKGMNYYRLKQVDFDGKYEYSPVVIVEMLGKGVSIFPNPATDVINVQIEAETARVEIFNINGQLIQTQILDNGIVAIANLVEGQYILRVIVSNEVMTETFVKQ